MYPIDTAIENRGGVTKMIFYAGYVRYCCKIC